MAAGLVTKEIESRIKQSPEHLFEVFLEIHQPINNDPPAILIQYPNDFSDPILKTVANFVYPCRITSDDQSEYFTFVVLDSTSLIFRFGYCRRSNREPTSLCIISYYPWFETFCNILTDLSQIINTKSSSEVDTFLLSLYNHKVMSLDDFYKHDGKEMIQITKFYNYSRPDQRKLPSMLSNSNFTIMYSRLGSDIILRLFAHLIFERRILFVSSKLFNLTACACGCLHLINPMHWQSIFLPILPESMTWTAQCTAPYVIGIHSSIFSTMNKNELGDVVIINIDNRTIQSQYDDFSLFPKNLIRIMRNDIQHLHLSELVDDNLARIFLRAMVFIFGNYASGFVIKNDKLDFDRAVYLKQYHRSELYTFMSYVVNTQMFEQFSRFRTYVELQNNYQDDEFDIEVKHFEQTHHSTKINNVTEHVRNENSSTPTNIAASNVEYNHQIMQQSNPSRMLNSQSSFSTAELDSRENCQLIDLSTDNNLSVPLKMQSTVNNFSLVVDTTADLSSKISSQLHSDNEEECSEINKLIEQFDPLNVSTDAIDTKSTFPTSSTTIDPLAKYPNPSSAKTNESNLIDLA